MLRLIFEKILKGEKLNDNERAFFLQWAEKAAALQVPPAQQVTIVEQNLTPLQSVVIREVENYVKSRGFITQISEITNKLGLMQAGEFRVGNDRAPGDGFTGGRFGYPGFTYDSVEWFLAGVENDVLKTGMSIEDGLLYAENATISGTLTVETGSTIAGWEITTDEIRKLVSNVGITINSSDTFIKIGDHSNTHILIDGANQRIGSSNFASGQVGFRINGATGDAEFNNIVARGEIKTTLLTSENQMAVGGNIIVSKDAGKLAADIDDEATTVNFGQSMTVGDWVKFQGPNSGGVNSLEWMLVGSNVSGTTYNVTRDVDGSGASGWLKDAPFAVIGAEGDSRIELVAGASASLQLITQGATWDAVTVQASMSTVAGAVTAGAGTVHIDSRGVVIDNAAPSLIFEDSGGNADNIYINATAIDSLEITNLVGGVEMVVKMTDAGLPHFEWKEDPDNDNVTQLNLSKGSAGGKFSMDTSVVIWAGKDGTRTDFNATLDDVDFAIYGENSTAVFFVDAADLRARIGADHYFPTRNASNKNGFWNEANQDMDFTFEGATAAINLISDAGLDAIGIGGAAESGYKLKVHGKVNLASGNTYDINGSPHAHKFTDVIGAHAGDTTVPASSTRYMLPALSGLVVTVSNSAWPAAGTLKNAFLRTGTTQPASGSLTATLVVNNVATSIVITIAAGATAAVFSDTTHTATLNAGDRIRWDVVNNATSASALLSSLTVGLEQNTG